jgi:signal transduction histidine kinase/CheY-like chemotaxis protein
MSNHIQPGFEAELRIPTGPVIAVLLVAGILPYFIAELTSSQWAIVNRAMSLSLAILPLGLAAWLITAWRPSLGRWFLLGALPTAIYAASLILDLPQVLILAALPVALATPLIRFSASILVAVLQTATLLLVPRLQPTLADAPTLSLAILATWAALGTTYGTHRPVHQLIDWVEDYFHRGQHFLEEARDHQAQLEQTLEAFATANRQLALANQRTTALREIAEEAQRAKTTFVANVSHEFRTPLNMIIGLVDLMVESPEIYAVVLPPDMRQDLQVIHRNCEHLSHMIDDVLDLTRIESGRLALHRERVALGNVIDASVAAVRPLLDKKQVAAHVQVPGDLPDVYCDRTRVQQVILNLVSNAARFTDHGHIRIEVHHQDGQVRISVQDTGAGIAPEDAETIFEPFDQGRLWHGRGGSGLGLSISRRFVELHGGRMWLESQLGVGTTFYFTLPISPPIAPLARPGHTIVPDWVWREPAVQASRASYSDRLTLPRLILCDPTGDLHAWFARHADTFECLHTHDISQVADALAHAPAHAILINTTDLDNLWPRMRELQSLAPDTPIMGCAVPRTLERAADAGALGYLVKPVTRASLTAALDLTPAPPRHILIVDDDPDVLQLFTRMLQLHDPTLDIATAGSTEAALRHLRTQPIDLMLLDVIMPGTDGWGLLTTLSTDPTLPTVPTLLVSAQDPADRPPLSPLIAATIGEGLPLSRLLRCTEELSTLLLEPEGAPDLVPG